MGLFDKKNQTSDAERKLSQMIQNLYGDVFTILEGINPTTWCGREGSTVVSIALSEGFGSEEDPIIEITAPCVFGAKDDPMLYRYLLRTEEYESTQEMFNSIFTHWEIEANEEPGKIDVYVKAYLQINSAEEAELAARTEGVARTADSYDDHLRDKFGGERVQEWFGFK